MEDLHEHYCEKCGYEITEEDEEDEGMGVSPVGNYLRSFVLRLASFVL